MLAATGCAGPPPHRDDLAHRCYYAAVVSTDVRPLPEGSIGICDHALMVVSLDRRDQAATYTNRGILRLNQSAYDQARQDFDHAIALAPNIGEPYVNRAAALLGLHRYADAIEDLNRAIELNSSSLEKAFYNRAIAREHLNDIRGAYYDYLKASQLRPDWSLPKQDLQRFKVTSRSRLA